MTSLRELSADDLDARIDVVSDRLAAAPKDRDLYRELHNLLTENDDRIIRARAGIGNRA